MDESISSFKGNEGKCEAMTHLEGRKEGGKEWWGVGGRKDGTERGSGKGKQVYQMREPFHACRTALFLVLDPPPVSKCMQSDKQGRETLRGGIW